MNTYDVIIIGAGISGLSSAFELCENSNKPLKVLILEKRETCGGNLRSIEVVNPLTKKKHWLDAGSIEGWASYKLFLGMLSKVHGKNMDSLLTPVTYKKMMHFVNEKENYYGYYDLSKASLSEHIALFYKYWWLSNLKQGDGFSMYQPKPIGRFNHNTISQELADAPLLRKFYSLEYTAYSYGSIKEEPVFLAIPFLLACWGDEFSFKGKGTQLATDPTVKYLLNQRRHPLVNVTILNSVDIDFVDASKHIVSIKSSKKAIFAFDHLILACPLGAVEVNSSTVERPLHQHSYPINNDSKTSEFRYTRCFVSCVLLDKMPLQQKWSANFEPVDLNLPIQPIAYTNLDENAGMKNCTLIYSLINQTDKRDSLSPAEEKQLIANINALEFFKRENCKVSALLYTTYFETSMPVMNQTIFEHLQSIQGKEHIYYASQALNTFPSLESACHTGRWAANRVLGGDALEKYMKMIRELDEAELAKFHSNINEQAMNYIWKTLTAPFSFFTPKPKHVVN
jgi:hypothetical protein